ncbi:MAG: DNA internalization-related competence protein ComEC/Rec2 [Porticoccaceae bacterium]
MRSLSLLAFAVAAFSSAFWPALPPPLGLACLATIALPFFTVAAKGNRWAVAVLAVSAGVVCASVWGFAALVHRLPDDLDKTDYRVQGRVIGLPTADARRVRFDLAVESIAPLEDNREAPPLKHLQLSWYGQMAIVPDQRWRLEVRLRRPRSLANPGGFDYAAWLLEQGVSATGYVRPSPRNQRLADATAASIDRLRFALREHIRQLPLSADARGFVAALTLGEQRDLSAAAWQRLKITGTLHLMVVSGQHIALAAGLGMILGMSLGRLLVMGGLPLPARFPGIVLAAVSAAFYAVISGSSISTERALVMLAVWLLALWFRRHVTAATGLLWALAAVSAIDPLAVLSAGFWLSFGAVAALLGYFSPRNRSPRNGSPRNRSPQNESPRLNGRGWWSFVPAQVVVFFALGGWLGLFQGQIPLLGPLANLIAVPWISLLVVPLCLLAVVLWPLDAGWAQVCWWLAGRQLEWFEQLLVRCAELSQQGLWQPQTSQRLLIVTGLIAAGMLLLSPRGLGLRAPGLILLIALAVARDDTRPPLAVTVLDVGQGLAAVVEAGDRMLVYDTGAAFSERFDAGSGIVAPFLRYRGWGALDALLVSHNDADHNGGVPGLLSQYQPRRWLVGEQQALADPLRQRLAAPMAVENCVAGDHWRWGEVDFLILHPPADFRGTDNNHSCVLLLSFRGARVLLTGDIETEVEAALLGTDALPHAVSLVVAPHHGSKTSSSRAFVEAVAPAHVVYSAGYRHHFGHPHAAVTARYRDVGAQPWNTAEHGALRFVWDERGELEIDAERDRVEHYWD